MTRTIAFLSLLALAALPGRDRAAAADDAPTLCASGWMLDAARAGLAEGSPAYRKYLSALLAEAALTMPVDELLAAVAEERDPALLEALGRALATRASYDEDPGLLQPLLDRAAYDADPALRAAAVRGLRATGSVETMAAVGGGIDYRLLAQDPAPEVRAAVADNLVVENEEVYGGRDARIAAAAVDAAIATPDPAVAARLLGEISMEQAPPDAVRAIIGALDAADPGVRAGAVLALGSAPPEESSAATLIEQYRHESDARVRAAILQALARLGQTEAIPTLRALRGVAPELDGEIDLWITVLELGLQEWHLILREKMRRTQGEPS